MNILFVSKLSGNLWAGPNNSVPAQVLAQSKIDNVFWYNLNNVKRAEWDTDELRCRNLTDYPSGRLCDLPVPFDRPDVAVIEEVYCHPFCGIIRDLQKARIPYVIIPRSTLTKQAQAKKHLKKVAANLVYFNRMIQKAAAIQYLTEQEKQESSSKWNREAFVIPNGINAPNKVKSTFHHDSVVCTYIGRIEPYQKGLDMLIDACREIRTQLLDAHCVIKLYGPVEDNALESLQTRVSSYRLEGIVGFFDGVFGKEKEQILLESDVFVLTSRFEGHPMGLIEAIAYGLPCLITRGTNIADEVKASSSGWTAENDVDSIRNAILDMLNDRSSLNEIGYNALELSKKYNWNTIAKISHHNYEELVKS